MLNSRPGLLDNLVIVTGQSQCSGPAIDSALLARDYAPVANLLGTVATGVLGSFTPGTVPAASQRRSRRQRERG